MTWTFDEDESIPFPTQNLGGSSGGTRRSGRPHCPSRRAIEAAESSLGSAATRRAQQGAKRKAPSASTEDERITRDNVVVDMDDSSSYDPDDEDEDSDVSMEPQDVDDLASTRDYESIRAMADADHEALHFKPKKESTKDIWVIFKKKKRYKHPVTGKISKGSLCLVCKKDPSIHRRRSAFLTGSTSSLRAHIARHHVSLYRKRCQALGIEPKPRALFRNLAASHSSSLTQTSLDSVVTCEPKGPPFTNAGLLDYIVEFIVCEDEAFLLIESDSFRRLLKFCRPSLSDKDIPSRNTLRAEVLRRVHIAQGRMRENMKRVPSKISFTFDTWTSGPGDPYISVTAHYIDTPADQPHAWRLKCEQLAFEEIKGRHTGENLADILARTLDDYRLHGKIGWFTSDGAAVNRATIRMLQSKFAGTEVGWSAMEHDMLCMEHSLHLAAKHFIQKVAPGLGSDVICKNLSDTSTRPGLENSVDNSDEEGFDSGDSLGKAIALVNRMRNSPQARAYFKEACKQVGIPQLEFVTWIRTRWGSLYKFLDRFLKLQKGIGQFILLVDANDHVPKLSGKRSYADFHLTERDWEQLANIKHSIRELSNAQQTFSKDRTPTVWRIISTFEFLIKNWDAMAGNPQFREVKDALNEGLKSLRKWYARVEGSCVTYFVCVVLDPNLKNLYFRARWDREQYAAAMKKLEEVFDSYYIAPEITTRAVDTIVPPMPKSPGHYGDSYLREAVKMYQQEQKAERSPRDELEQYLNSGAEAVADVALWWGTQSDEKYPTLKRIARDYLPIQGSATPSERAFSSGGITDCLRRNSLTTEIFEGLQILKSAYRNGHISAVTQAAQHFDVLVQSFDDAGDTEVDPIDVDSILESSE